MKIVTNFQAYYIDTDDRAWILKTVLAILDIITCFRSFQYIDLVAFRYLKFSYLLNFLEGHIQLNRIRNSKVDSSLRNSTFILHSMLSCIFSNNGIEPFIGKDEWIAMQRRVSYECHSDELASAVIFERKDPDLFFKIFFPNIVTEWVQFAKKPTSFCSEQVNRQLLFFPVLKTENLTHCGRKKVFYVSYGSKILFFDEENKSKLDTSDPFTILELIPVTKKQSPRCVLNVGMIGENTDLIICRFRKDSIESKFLNLSWHDSSVQIGREITILIKEDDYVALALYEKNDKDLGGLFDVGKIAHQFAPDFDFHSFIFALNDYGFLLFKLIS